MTAFKKEFFIYNGHSVASDTRDHLLDGNLDADVYAWCRENSINAFINIKLEGKSIWRIPDEKQRAWFALRWL